MALRVLVIDDNAVSLRVMTAMVRQFEDVEPVAFDDPVEAMAWCQREVPDLVLVESMMAELDGIAFMEQLRQIAGREDTPVLVVTAGDARGLRDRALERGANDYLCRPIDPAEFMARVRNMLLLRRNQRQLGDRAQWLSEAVRQATTELLAREQDTIFRLARAAEYRDPETGFHVQRMAAYSHHVARHLGLSVPDLDLLLKAAPMHDVGKVGIPDHILLKPGRLTPEEFEQMTKHAVMGYEILKGSTSALLQAAAQIALTHHEKWDGSGYPLKLAGEKIPLFGRIAAVADVFDALTSERPHKPAWEVERAAMTVREGRGGHFDPACVDAFFQDWEAVLAVRERYQDEVNP